MLCCVAIDGVFTVSQVKVLIQFCVLRPAKARGQVQTPAGVMERHVLQTASSARKKCAQWFSTNGYEANHTRKAHAPVPQVAAWWEPPKCQAADLKAISLGNMANLHSSMLSTALECRAARRRFCIEAVKSHGLASLRAGALFSEAELHFCCNELPHAARWFPDKQLCKAAEDVTGCEIKTHQEWCLAQATERPLALLEGSLFGRQDTAFCQQHLTDLSILARYPLNISETCQATTHAEHLWLSKVQLTPMCNTHHGASALHMRHLSPQCFQWCVLDIDKPTERGWSYNGLCFSRFNMPVPSKHFCAHFLPQLVSNLLGRMK